MFQPRFLSPYAESDSCVYHCISRVIEKKHVLQRKEKEVFVRMMREYEAFCGVQVLAYCVMSNHFHLLVEVPPKVKGAAVAMTDDVFLTKIKTIYSGIYYRDIEQKLENFRANGADKAALEFKAKYTRRMHDLSEFMKGLKQRFTQWYNGAHARKGTLWESRFKSVLVQGGYATRVVAAYIDLNPIRAGMVEKPEDYTWCSYAEALKPKNNQAARAGLCRVLCSDQKLPSLEGRGNQGVQGAQGIPEAQNKSKNRSKQGEQCEQITGWDDGVAERYRMMLFADGEEVFVDERETGTVNKRVRKGFSRREVKKVLARGGKLSFGEALRCRVRYFSDGMTVGKRAFVEEVFKKARHRFGEKRKSGARPMRGVGWQKKESKLFSMRQLVKDRLG